MADDPMTNDAESRIREELNPAEVLLWAGRPRQGLVLRKGEWFVITPHLLLLAFAIFWTVVAIAMGAPIEFRIAGVLFIGLALYVTIGRFWGDSYERSKTFYGLTNKRVIIIWGLLWQLVRSVPLEIIDDVLIREDANQSATIRFIRKWSIMSIWLNDRWNFHRVHGVPQFETYTPPEFEMIDDAKPVVEIIQKAWDDARSMTKNQFAKHQ